MKILGLYGAVGFNTEIKHVHSSGVSLWVESKLINSILEERLDRKKYSGEYPALSIDYILENNSLKKEDIDVVCYTHNIHTSNINSEQQITKILKNEFVNAEIEFCDHHQGHSLGSAYSSPFEKSSIFSADGAGCSYNHIVNNQLVTEYETGLFAYYDRAKGITVLNHFKNGLNNRNVFNLGQVYNNISRYIYTRIEPEKSKKFTNPYLFMETAPGKIMGLAGYGNADNVDVESLFEVVNDKFYFPTIYDRMYNFDLFKKLDCYEPQDIAAWLQKCFEDAIVDFFECLHPTLKTENLVFSGGSSLNILVNRKLIDKNIFKDIHVTPWTNDTGLAISSGVYSVLKHEKELPIFPENLASLGKSYTREDILKAMK